MSLREQLRSPVKIFRLPSDLYTNKNRMTFVIRPFSAESEGFEPPDPLRSTVFKTAAFDHSANSPKYVSRNGIAKVQRIFKPANFYSTFFSSFAKNLY